MQHCHLPCQGLDEAEATTEEVMQQYLIFSTTLFTHQLFRVTLLSFFSCTYFPKQSQPEQVLSNKSQANNL